MINIETIAANLFEKIRSRFEDISVGDQDAKATEEPEKCRFFNFDYIDRDGNNFGNVTISLIDETSLQIFFGKNLSADLDADKKEDWYNFLRDIRMFAKRHLLNFDARDISRSSLNIKDLKHLSKTKKPDTIHTTDVTESKLYGNTKTSFKTISPSVRLRIKHSGVVDETKQGARSRYIESVFIEDDKGQRLLSPCKNLAACSALGRHVSNGGNPHDDFGKHIVELADEMSAIKEFVNRTRNKTFEDGEANEIASAAHHRHHEIRNILQRVAGPRGYHLYKENWTPSETSDVDTTPLREKFVQHSFDERLERGLPHAYRAYENMKQSALETQMREFTEAMESLSEGTWSVPDNDVSVQHLQELMAEPLEAGVDGSNATSALYDIIGDDELFDRIYDASKGSPEMDVRPIVTMWLEKNMPSVAAKLSTSEEPEQEEPAPAPEPAPEPAPAPEQEMDPEAPMPGTEQPPQQQPQPQMQSGHSTDKALLDDIKRLAGLK